MDKKLASAKVAYGLTQEVFAARKGDDETIVVGGVGLEARRWARALTRRAAHQLWYHLTGLLFPEKSVQVTAMAQTAPLHNTAHPALTTRLELVRNSEAHTVYIFGWIGKESWWFCVDEQTARHLWTALDIALYPAGWQGPATKYNTVN